MRVLLASCMLLAMSIVPALAQDLTTPDLTSYDELTQPEPRLIDNVTVTDQYRSYLEEAESITLLRAKDVELIVHPAEAINRTAGVNIHRGSGQEHLTAIRSPVLTGGSGAGSFLYLQDGIPLRAAGFANVNGLFETSTEFARQIEVFKGPGPAQYGSNAVHGLINVVSKDVGDAGGISVIASSRGYGRVTAAANVSDTLRASLSLAHDDGFRDDSGFDQQKAQLRYVDSLGAWDVDWISSFTNLNQETAGFLQGDDAYRDDALNRTNPNPEAFRDGKTYRTQARFSRNINDTELVITPYARRAELRFLRHFVPGQALEKNGHSSVGVQSKLIGDDWSLGGDVEYTKGSLYEFQAGPTAGFRRDFVQGLHFDYDVDALVGAVYATKDWSLTESLRLDLGVRAEYTHYDYNNKASDGRSGRFIRSADRTDDFLTITPKVGLIYEADNNITLFARAARGSRAPQTSDLYSAQINQVPGEAEVETLDSLEGGVRFANAFGVTVYTMWKDNFFFRDSQGLNVVDGKTRHTGVELSFKRDVSDNIYISGEGTLAKHSYAFNLEDDDIVKGNRVDTAPDTIATMRVGVRPAARLNAEIEWRHMGSYFTNPGNTASYPGHDIFVLRGGYDVSDNVRLFGRVDNVFNTRYADRADFAFRNERYFPGRPRTLFLGLSLGL